MEGRFQAAAAATTSGAEEQIRHRGADPVDPDLCFTSARSYVGFNNSGFGDPLEPLKPAKAIQETPKDSQREAKKGIQKEPKGSPKLHKK